MRTSRASLLAGLALTIGGGAAGWAQQRGPESILPPGFGEPTQSSPVPAASASPRPVAKAPGEVVQPLPGPETSPAPSPTPTATVDPEALAEYELPSLARRSLDSIGPVSADAGGMSADAFGQRDGRQLERWMRGLRTPIASRWLAITLRRLLVSQLDTPAHVDGADFAAERAWLLIRMGEAVAARGVVASVDNNHYTPKLYQVALQSALASADPAAVCQVDEAAAIHDRERAWPLIRAMCSSLSGSGAAGQAQLASARRAGVAGGIDLALAQKVVGVGGQGRQAVTVDWGPVDKLTAWRWGLATATGVAIPDELYATAGRQVTGWRALAPAIAPAKRAVAAEQAAAMGVISSAALVDLYASLQDNDADDSDAQAASGVAADLATAYSDPDGEARHGALRRLWGGGASDAGYARLVLTARAAATITPRAGDPDADKLIAAMLSAGLDRTALRWRNAAAVGTDGWAMLLLADPDAYGRQPYATLGRYGQGAAKQRLLFAGLAGLGRLSGDDVERGTRELGVALGRENSWTRAIDRSAQDGEPGTAVLLGAIGMQAPGWGAISPEALFHIVAALHATGLDGPARMIAAEAIARA